MKKTTCSNCNSPIEENRVKSGQSFCASCQRDYLRLNRKKFIELDEISKSKHLARTKANTYLRRGKIKKTGCFVCGVECNIEMHHDDYSKPLEIKWFCRKHHMEFHKTKQNN